MSLWNDKLLNYSFGDCKKMSASKKTVINTKIQERFTSTSWREHNIYMVASSSKLWDTEQGKAIEYGNLIHEMMAEIYTKNDVERIVKKHLTQGTINLKDSNTIENSIRVIINHPKVTEFYTDDVTVYNERELVTIDKQKIIPDRLVFTNENEVVIIDYKTGKPSKSHQQQLLKYEAALQSMNFKVVKKLLIYIDETILIEEI